MRQEYKNQLVKNVVSRLLKPRKAYWELSDASVLLSANPVVFEGDTYCIKHHELLTPGLAIMENGCPMVTCGFCEWGDPPDEPIEDALNQHLDELSEDGWLDWD